MVDLNELSLEEKIGQMMLVGMNTNEITKNVKDLIVNNKIGGVLLYKRNYNSYQELIDVVNYLKELNKTNKIPLLISIDQEGGRVNRLPDDFEKIPSAFKLARCDNINVIKKAGNITGEILQKSGINMNFAPVLDIKRFENGQAIGDRAFSEDYQTVSKCGITFMNELQKNNVIPVIKHFPGHGTTTKDSHFWLPKIDKEIAELEKEDIIPFVNAIQSGAEALLIGHLIFKKITKNYPATMSKKIIKYIREDLQFDGLIITDDMRMRGVLLRYGSNFPIVKAMQAGNDLIMFKYKENDTVIKNVINLVKKGKINIEQVNKSVQRIIDIKAKYNVNDKKIENILNIDKINMSIKNLNNIEYKQI